MLDRTIALAHNSAGPKMDIVVPVEGRVTGFLARTDKEYCKTMYDILQLPQNDRLEIQVRVYPYRLLS